MFIYLVVCFLVSEVTSSSFNKEHDVLPCFSFCKFKWKLEKKKKMYFVDFFVCFCMKILFNNDEFKYLNSLI